MLKFHSTDHYFVLGGFSSNDHSIPSTMPKFSAANSAYLRCIYYLHQHELHAPMCDVIFFCVDPAEEQYNTCHHIFVQSRHRMGKVGDARDGWRGLLDPIDHRAIIHDRDRRENNGILVGGGLGYVRTALRGGAGRRNRACLLVLAPDCGVEY